MQRKCVAEAGGGGVVIGVDGMPEEGLDLVKGR